MKVFLIMIVLLLLTACEPSADEFKPQVLPEGLQDCAFYRITNSHGGQLFVVRCPLSSTTINYKLGKTTRIVTTTSGEEI